MREFSTPLGDVVVPESGNLTDDVVANAVVAPLTPAFSRRTTGGWAEVTCAEFLHEVRALAKGLVAAGLRPGDRVALVSSTRYEWTLVDYATWFAGGVVVPVYPTSGEEQLAWVLADSGATAVVVEHDEHRAKVAAVRDRLPDLRHVWALDDGAVDELARAGAEVTDDELEQRRTGRAPVDLATIIYTSGTTGRPKGCMLTHGNLMTELAVTLHELDDLFGPPADEGDQPAAHGRHRHDDHDHDHHDDRDGRGARGPLARLRARREPAGPASPDQPTTVLFLPLPHVFARIIQIGCVRTRTRLAHCSDLRVLGDDLRELRPTFVLAVPRVFERMFNTASQQATADGRGAAFDRAVENAIAWSRAQDAGKVPVAVRAQRLLLERAVHRQLRDTLGGSCRYAVSGGAPLGERLGHFFRGVGLTVLEGWGLTETAAAVTVNTPDAVKIGTVGRPLPGTAVRVADDGELLVRGRQVFAGYWDDEEATAAALEPDGWLHTGDVGEVDDEGFVRITGRLKEILVTAGGKSVAPGTLEDAVRSHPLVSQCLVVGDGQPWVAALVTLDRPAAQRWARAHDKPTDLERLARDPDLVAAVQEAVDEANARVSKAEAIRRFTVLPQEWTEESGHLTPSMKLRRAQVTRDFRREVADLYARPGA